MRFLMVLLLAVPQDVKLQPKAAVGDKTTVSVDSALDLEFIVKDGEGESNRLLSVVRREKFSQEVTRVTDGMASTLAIVCLSSTLQKSGTNIALGTSVTPLAGRSFVGTRSAQGWVVTDQDGNPPPSVGRALGAWNEYVRLLPGGAVKTGDSWKVESADVAHLLFAPGTTHVAGALDCTVESLSGGRATILIKGSAEGHSEDGSVLALTLSGSRLVFDTGKGRPLSLTINGSLQSSREIVEVTRKAGTLEDERRKVGEVVAKSRKLEVSFFFE